MDADAAIASLEYTISQINKHVKRESTNGARFKTQVSAFSRFVDTSHFFVWPDDKIIDIAWGHVKTAIDCIVIYETLNHTIAWFPRHSNIWSVLPDIDEILETSA